MAIPDGLKAPLHPAPAGPLSSFRLRDFRLLWVASLCFSAGMWIQQVAVGWLVVEMTDSALALAVVQAARLLPLLPFGMVAGVLADRLERRALLVVVGAVSAAYSGLLALLISVGGLELGHIVVLTLAFGACRAFEWPAAQALVYDIVGGEDALKGISLNATASRTMGMGAGFLGGAVIPASGPEGSLLLMSAGYAAGCAVLLFVRPRRRERSSVQGPPFWRSLLSGYALVRTNARMRVLLILSVAAEMFAFSHGTLVPIFARDVLQAGPVGLGALTSARAAGSVASALVLAQLAYFPDKMRLLLQSFALYGACLLAFALSRELGLSLLLMVGIGMAASAFDLLQQTTLQQSVADEDRGRAMGYWVASLGFGPLGHLELGSLAVLLGAPVALGINSIVAIAVVLVVAGWHSRAAALDPAAGISRGTPDPPKPG